MNYSNLKHVSIFSMEESISNNKYTYLFTKNEELMSFPWNFHFNLKNELIDRYLCILMFSYAITIPMIYRNRNQHHFRFFIKNHLKCSRGENIYRESRTGNLSSVDKIGRKKKLEIWSVIATGISSEEQVHSNFRKVNLIRYFRLETWSIAFSKKPTLISLFYS